MSAITPGTAVDPVRFWSSLRLDRLARPRIATLALAATGLFSLYFLLFPGVDVGVSAAFHTAGEGFALSSDPALRALRKSSTIVLGLILLGVIGRIVFRLIARRSLGRDLRRGGFLLIGLAVGPGLLVNTVLKGLWGRPRPVHTEMFGGDTPYVPVWQISDWCQSNCSFVSGEASSAAWLVAAAWVLCPPAWRPWALPLAVAYGVALSLNRLAFGGHFLSDILLSWSLMGLVLAVLYPVLIAAPTTVRRRLRRTRGLTPGLSPA
ncbi:MAG: phosphatase PAP2 family protein [Brevundimonas sp.]|uniref:phosphatase PAP2 family protein n=1 Tax=Brevundimonas sp. TaxID=1871086 RepID=UPI0027322DB4|nr:phosphatase PAP2 family protein [Brevundimonas sp.]MDP3379186.1 phosphatase PAP2 family protein [Brevundimonas sp.]